MNKTFVLSILLAAAACNEPAPSQTPTEDPERGTGKADLVGSCEGSTCDGQANNGSCFCDDACVEFGDCCADKAEICGGVACEDLGGECLSQPGDPGFAALCESDLGRETLAGECPAFNLACCGDAIEPEGNACEAAGGTCHSQPGDPGFPALCESDLGLEPIDADCGAVNLACCGDAIEPEPNACEEAGGTCHSQPGDPGFPALCESDLGLEPIDADCGAMNLACCGDAVEEPDNACEEAGGTCHSQPGDPGFPALCERNLGLQSIDADCGAFNLACCGEPV